MKSAKTLAGRYLSPLRYPGGKAKLASYVQAIVETNGVMDSVYVEPFAGGASVALSLLMEEYVKRIHINDIDRCVYGFWHSVMEETDALCRLIRDRRASVAEWHRQKAVHSQADDASLLECGFAAFFLNRTNRSGVIASGGMIGGTRQTGNWKIDARYNKQELIRRIEAIASFRGRITLHNSDSAELLRSLLPTLPARSFLYLDPPYYVKGQRRLYANFYVHKDHAEVAGILENAKAPWIVSYDDTKEIRALYKKFRSVRYKLGYSANEVCSGAEVMFFSDNLQVPRSRPLVA
jgi:DNA adenine methylase